MDHGVILLSDCYYDEQEKGRNKVRQRAAYMHIAWHIAASLCRYPILRRSRPDYNLLEGITPHLSEQTLTTITSYHTNIEPYRIHSPQSTHLALYTQPINQQPSSNPQAPFPSDPPKPRQETERCQTSHTRKPDEKRRKIQSSSWLRARASQPWKESQGRSTGLPSRL